MVSSSRGLVQGEGDAGKLSRQTEYTLDFFIIWWLSQSNIMLKTLYISSLVWVSLIYAMPFLQSSSNRVCGGITLLVKIINQISHMLPATRISTPRFYTAEYHRCWI